MLTGDPFDPNTTGAAIARIRAWAKASGLQKSPLAVKAGMVATVLRHFDRADWNPTADTLRRLEALIPPGWQVGDPVSADEYGPSMASPPVIEQPDWDASAQLAKTATQVTIESDQAIDETRADLALRQRA